jgi:excisionase family DNA binding protein
MSQLATEARTLTLQEVSAALRITRKTTLGLIGRGELVAFKVGQVWRVDAPDLEAYIAAQKRAARQCRNERPAACAR